MENNFDEEDEFENANEPAAATPAAGNVPQISRQIGKIMERLEHIERKVDILLGKDGGPGGGGGGGGRHFRNDFRPRGGGRRFHRGGDRDRHHHRQDREQGGGPRRESSFSDAPREGFRKGFGNRDRNRESREF